MKHIECKKHKKKLDIDEKKEKNHGVFLSANNK